MICVKNSFDANPEVIAACRDSLEYLLAKNIIARSTREGQVLNEIEGQYAESRGAMSVGEGIGIGCSSRLKQVWELGKAVLVAIVAVDVEPIHTVHALQVP